MNRRFSTIIFVAIFCFSISAQTAEKNKFKPESDIAYIPNGEDKQQLDLYLPDKKNFTTVVFVHGGSLLFEDRKDKPYPQIGEAFQKAGIACAVISYRLGKQANWAAQPRDVAAAFAWVKANIEKRGGDKEKVYLVGHSSGGYLAALLSTDEKYLKEKSLSLKDIAGTVPMGTLLDNRFPFEKETPEQIKRVFEKDTYFNIFGNLETYLDSFPLVHINSKMPRMLILIAEKEQLHPPILDSTQKFVKKADEVGVRVEYEILPNRTHMETIRKMPESGDPTMLRIIRFIRNEGEK